MPDTLFKFSEYVQEDRESGRERRKELTRRKGGTEGRREGMVLWMSGEGRKGNKELC